MGQRLSRVCSYRKGSALKKFVVAALAVAALGGSVLALSAAAAPSDPSSPPGDAREAGGFMLDAHLAGMKAALKLTPDQEKNWAAFEAAVRDAAQARRDAMRAMRDATRADERPSPIERMNTMADRLAKASTEIKAIAAAAKPLYDSLDDGQRRHFGPLMATLIEHGPHRGMMMGPHGGDGPHWMGPRGDRPADHEED
jgi:Spy/CpxP family protein refolding chaperone